MPIAWLAVALVFLVGFRVALNVVDSNVIDVGYAGVLGADRIVDGDGLYGDGFSRDVPKGDTYGPVNYLLYVPFEQAMPWSGRWDDLPAAHGAAIAFDLLTIGVLLLLGRALRPGREGTALGVALAYAWAAYPYTAFALETNSNDTLVALACARRPARLRAPLGRRHRRGRSGSARRPSSRRWRSRRCSRGGARSCSALALAAVARGHGRAVHPRRRAARALRPHARLPGRARLAVQRVGPGAVARLAADAGQGGRRSGWPCWWRSCRGGRATASSPRWARPC